MAKRSKRKADRSRSTAATATIPAPAPPTKPLPAGKSRAARGEALRLEIPAAGRDDRLGGFLDLLAVTPWRLAVGRRLSYFTKYAGPRPVWTLEYLALADAADRLFSHHRQHGMAAMATLGRRYVRLPFHERRPACLQLAAGLAPVPQARPAARLARGVFFLPSIPSWSNRWPGWRN